MSGYIGTVPVPQATTVRTRTVATAGQTSFPVGSYQPGFLFATLNGVEIDEVLDFTASNGSDLILNVPATAGDLLKTMTHNTFEVSVYNGDLEVQGDVTANEFIGGGSQLTGIESVPTGLISMWYGSIANIPAGYFLCDGTNGTPDLRNKFVMGAGSTYNPDDAGGSNSVTLATANLPAHTHGDGSLSGSTNTTGNHSHSGSTNTTGNHSHNIDYYFGNFSNPGNISGGETLHKGSKTTSSAGNHSHTISTNTTGNHSHSVSISGSTGSTGSGTAIDTTPEYYALAYIMKG